MKNSLLYLLLLIATSASAVVPFQIPNDQVNIGKGVAADKIILFQKGAGSANPKIRWNNSTSKIQVSNDGTTYFDLSAGGSSLFGQIVGSSAQVSAGIATASSIGAAITAASAGDSILILAGSWTESVVVAKKLYFIGSGHGSLLTGTWQWSSGSSNSGLSGIKLTGDMTIDSGVSGLQVQSIWFASGKTFMDNTSSPLNNYLQGFQE